MRQKLTFVSKLVQKEMIRGMRTRQDADHFYDAIIQQFHIL